MASAGDLYACWEEAGVNQGDELYVASDVSNLLMTGFSPDERKNKRVAMDAIVDSLQQAVGDTGTLLFPMFTWDFCHGLPYDIRRTRGRTGALGNWALMHRKEFARTRHPIYSFMVWGAKAEEYLALQNKESFAKDSPFGLLHAHGGKQLNIDTELPNSFTYLHYVEECIRAPYRYLKDFCSDYTDENGTCKKCVYSMFVRDLNFEYIDATNDNFMLNHRAMKRIIWHGVIMRFIDLAIAYDAFMMDMLHNGGKNSHAPLKCDIDWYGGQTHPDETLEIL